MRKAKEWNKEEVIEAVKKSISIADCLRNLKLVGSGGNYSTFYKIRKMFNLDTSHFLGKSHLLGKTRPNLKKTPIEEFLVENSECSVKNLKRRLIDTGMIENKCQICGMKPEWKDKPLVLIIDHINGKNTDNRLENLRMLCPNCNSQTDTFCGRNRKNKVKENRCVDCGIIIDPQSTRCAKHAGMRARKVVERPSLETLLKEVNETNYEAVGRKYGVTGSNVKKWINIYKREEEKLKQD